MHVEPGDMIALLAWRSRITPDRAAFELSGTQWTFERLWRELCGFAEVLSESGLQSGECVLVAIPNHPDFFAVFYGIQRAGGVPVPVYPDSGPKRLARIAAICDARFLVTFANPSDIPQDLKKIDPDARAIPKADFPFPGPDRIAYIQFTSGSTGDPKGVPITHANLLTNIRQLIAGMEITAGDVFVSWLPVYHDMGLILMTMVPFFLSARLILLPTSFINLRRWLATISEVRGTFTASPDFGYRLALRYAARPEEYDLTSLRVALNAAEPARPETIRSFEKTFGLQHVMSVGYGLAEATVGVSMTAPGTRVRVDADGFTSVGKPFPQIELRIRGEDGTAAPTGEPGEVLVKSPANSHGYFRDPGSKEILFSPDGRLKTGDIGYLDEAGELFIIGRQKEMLKHSGRTLAPREVEAALDDYPGLRSVAAISLDLGGLAGEQVLIIAEVDRPKSLSEEDMHALAVDLNAAVYAQLGIRPARVYLAQPHTIPLTANGKLQRSLLRSLVRDGSLKTEGKLLYPDF